MKENKSVEAEIIKEEEHEVKIKESSGCSSNCIFRRMFYKIKKAFRKEK